MAYFQIRKAKWGPYGKVRMWIKALPKTENALSGLPVFYRQFRLDKKVVKCVLEISALGIFPLEIYGRSTGDYFMPGWTNYYKYAHLCAYDITKFLRKDNLVAITLADGWYAGRLGYHKGPNFYGDETALYVKITLTCKDGSVCVLDGDSAWKVGSSRIRSSSFFDGEYVDFTSPKEDLATLPSARECDLDVALQPYAYQPVRRVAEFAPTVLYQDENTLRLDFGQNIAGFLNFTAKGDAGTKITVRHAEMLNPDGTLYYENLRKVKAEDIAVLSGGKDRFDPTFTFHGFRYAEIKADGAARIDRIRAVAISQDLDYHGRFVCSNPIMNKVYYNALWGQLDNLISIPIDCPQRDERLGWTGDAQVFCNSAMYNADCNAFFENYLKLIRADVLDDGKIPSLVPFIAPVSPTTAGVPGWADAICVIPYTHYLHYGDKQVLIDNLPYAIGHVEYYLRNSEKYLSKVNNPFGDWLSVERADDVQTISQCFFGLSAYLVSRMCAIVGDEENAQKYAAHYDGIKAAFRANFLSDNGKVQGDSQTAYALALAVDFVAADEIKSHFVAAIERNDGRLTTGFIGVKYLLPALCAIGETELAYKIIQETRYPSWGYTIENGATTIWERWNGYTQEDGFATPSMNSFNHYSLGSCVEWLYSYVLGIQLSEDRVKVAPALSQSLDFAKGEYRTKQGKIAVAWKRKSDAYLIKIKAEKGVDFTYNFGDKQAVSVKKTGRGLRAVVKNP